MRNKRMIFTLGFVLVISLAAAALVACTGGADQATLVGPEWQLVSIGGEAPPENVNITALFSEEEVGGSSGCNSYGGSYTVDGGSLQIGPLASTLMACDEPLMTWEGKYLKAMQAAQSFRISGNELEITTGEGVLSFNGVMN